MARRKGGENPDQALFEFVDRLPNLDSIVRNKHRENVASSGSTIGQASAPNAPQQQDIKIPEPNNVVPAIEYVDYLILCVGFGLGWLLVAEVIFDAGIARKYLGYAPTAPVQRTLFFAFLGVANVFCAYLLQGRAMALRSKFKNASPDTKRAGYHFIVVAWIVAAVEFLLAVFFTADDLGKVLKNILDAILLQQTDWGRNK